MENKKNLIIVMICALVIITLGTSYALLRNNQVSSNPYTMNVAGLSVTFQEGTQKLNLTNAYPMTDEEGMEQTNVLNFTIENNQNNLKANYDIYIEETSSNPSFKPVIRYSVNKGETEFGDPQGLENNMLYIDKDGTIESGTTINYKVKMWVSETADNTYMNKTFTAKVVIVSKQAPDDILESERLITNINEKITNEEGVYYFDDNGDLDYGDNTKITLNITNNIPKGNVSIWNNQVIYACFNYNGSNYEYSYNETKKIREVTERSMPCITDRYQNLVINGDLSYESNYNLEELGTYNQEGYLSLTTNGRADKFSTDYIPIDPNKKYEIGLDMKASNTNARYYVGFIEYDVDMKYILPYHVMYKPNTLTELTEDLIPGQTVVHLKDLTNWDNETSANTQKGFIFWNYKDSTGYQYPELTYSQKSYSSLYKDNNAVNKTTNTITLDNDWSEANETIPKGTKVSQSNDGMTYNYSVMEYKNVTTDFRTYKSNGLITGINSAYSVSFSSFRAGTKFIKFVIRFNFNSTPNTTTDIKNLYIREVKE